MSIVSHTDTDGHFVKREVKKGIEASLKNLWEKFFFNGLQDEELPRVAPNPRLSHAQRDTRQGEGHGKGPA